MMANSRIYPISIFLGVLSACAGPSTSILSQRCEPTKGQGQGPQNPNSQVVSNLSETPEEEAPGKQLLRGYFDTTWKIDGVNGQKRCIMNLLPDEGDGSEVKIITAGHCLPELPDAPRGIFRFKLYLAYRNGFIGLNVGVPSFERSVALAYLVKTHVAPKMPNGRLGYWLPEFGTNVCKEMTREFKTQSRQEDKTACFSRQDLRIITAKVTEENPRSLKRYAELLAILNRTKGAAQKKLPESMKKDYQALWSSSNLYKVRKRNLRTIAYLSNVQFCRSSQGTTNPILNEPDTRVFCEMTPEIREQFFTETTTDTEYQGLLAIRNDEMTPLQNLRDMYLGCIRSPFSGPDDEASCEQELATKAAFDKWVQKGEVQFSALADAEKRGLSFADYFQVVTEKNSDTSKVRSEILPIAGNVLRTSLSNTESRGVFLFDYDPLKMTFSFKKGDSGSLLNIFWGYPVAVLSTVDGEPTSGGASVTSLPEPDEEKAERVESQSKKSCL
ncbi:MAG: hypothetical protein RL189_615 [Pseudomonadota bacterium]|jgi:hypothetical protein